MVQNKSIGFIGGSRITKIFLQAFKKSDMAFREIAVFDINSETLLKLEKSFPSIITAGSAGELAGKCDIVFLAVHPPAIMDILAEIRPVLKKNALVVSLAPKITIEKMETALGGFKSIARANPSANGIINRGINPVAFAESLDEGHKNSLLALLRILGKAPVVAEAKIEAYAVISAMGPTYFWFQLQKLAELGVQFGMNESEAKEVIAEMMKGTVGSLFYSGLPAAEIMDLVPVRPLAEFEETIQAFYTEKLRAVYEKIKP